MSEHKEEYYHIDNCTGLLGSQDIKELVKWKYWVPGVCSTCLITLGCLGNLLAIFILRKPKLCTAFNQLLITLCIIDTCVLLSNIPTTVNSLGTRVLAPIERYVNLSSHVFICASIFLIVSLSMERRFAICSPHAYRIQMKTVPRWRHLAKYIIPVILTSLLLNIPLFLNLKKDIRHNYLYVKTNLYLRAVHPLTTLGWLPFATLTFLNLRISQGIRKLQQPKLVTPALSLNSAQCKALERKNKRHSKEIRATHLSIVIVITFALLNIPRCLASSIEVINTELITFCMEHKVKYLPSIGFYKLDFVARALMLFNSGINIIIYCAVSTPFQEVFMATFCPCLKRLTSRFRSSERVTTTQNDIDDDDGLGPNSAEDV